jgi:dienelactone hydrolase
MLLIIAAMFFAGDAPPETGTLSPAFRNREGLENVAHLTPPETPFSWRLEAIYRDAVYTVSRLTFPSPVASPHPCNNTVWCDYYRPRGSKRIPAVVLLHFLNDPGFWVTRMVAEHLARHGCAALLLRMAYYGERRPPALTEARTADLDFLVTAWRQSAQDIRRALAWLTSRPEVDPARSGILGISLGAMVGGVVTAVDPSVKRAVLVLGGGDINEVLWTAPETASLRAVLTARGTSREETRKRLEPVEPLRFARPLPRGTLLMINARKDRTVPPSCVRKLARAFDTPDVAWYETTHVGLASHLTEVLERTVGFLVRP